MNLRYGPVPMLFGENVDCEQRLHLSVLHVSKVTSLAPFVYTEGFSMADFVSIF